MTNIDDNGVLRQVTITPAMCGYNSLFVSQVGDWTYDTIKTRCGTDVFGSRDAAGMPTYLAFYYMRFRNGPLINPRSFTFGDRLTVLSSCFDYGSRAVLTLHRITWAESLQAQARSIDPIEFYDKPLDDCLYVESFNRWVTRRTEESNNDLIHSSPADFRHKHLPTLEDRYSPRLICQQAKTHHAFYGRDAPAGYATVVRSHRTQYRIDITRDLNGVRLVYFASYFSIVDAALWRLWQHLGRDEVVYLDTCILERSICFLGNVNPGVVLELDSSLLRSGDEVDEIVNVVIREHRTERLIAICTLRTVIRRGDPMVVHRIKRA